VNRPAASDYPPFYERYVSLVPEGDVLAVLEAQRAELRILAAGLGRDGEETRYAPGKWSIREMMGHLRDAEREFGHRAFRISRGDETPLPGFEENQYVAAARFDRRPAAALVDELLLLREANLALLRQLPDEAWSLRGVANGVPVSVVGLAYMLAGHVRHHFGVLRERYGVPAASTDAAPGAGAVRPARADDLASLAELRHRFRTELGDSLEDRAVEDRAEFLARCRDWMLDRLAGSSWKAWVARDGGRLVGTAWAHLVEKVPNPVGEPESHAYLTSLYVAAEARGRGLGSELLRAALEWCGERGVDAVLLWPSPRSRPLYERHGFAVRDDVLELRLGGKRWGGHGP
jgi:GNAT superfamily N-acetyltransferase